MPRVAANILYTICLSLVNEIQKILQSNFISFYDQVSEIDQLGAFSPVPTEHCSANERGAMNETICSPIMIVGGNGNYLWKLIPQKN